MSIANVSLPDEIGTSNGNPSPHQNRRTARRPRLHAVCGVIFILLNTYILTLCKYYANVEVTNT